MKIIVAIDQTLYWKQVIEGMLKRHWPKDTSFKILSIIEPTEWHEFDNARWCSVVKDILVMRQKHTGEILAEARKSVEKALPDCSVHIDQRHGNARNEIIKAAIEWMPDKIVLGAHGHAPNRLLPGTVSRSVAQHAPCSIELVRLKQLVPTHYKRKKEIARSTARC